MRIPRIFYAVLAVTLLVSLLPLTVVAEKAAIEQELLDKFAADGTANFFVKMAVDADLSAAYGMDWAARGQFVWNALNEVAAQTQAPVIAYAQKHGLDYTSMLTTNSVFVRGATLEAAQGLAALPGVAYLRLERVLAIPDPLVGAPGINGFAGESVDPEATTDWGITDTKADQFWTAFGFQGDGIKVANIDTGVQYDHPALYGQFACPGDPTSAACWRDPSDICPGDLPCDNNGHGTHTMGTMVADDDPNLAYIAGMAPNSSWIACKGCETNSCSEFALTTCADWLVAPGGDPNNRPNVVNNSWGGGGGDSWYLSYVNAWRAAGIFPAFSAGNSGSGCGTLGSPGDYQESFGSAAHASNRVIASFSSRGPSAFGHDPYTKPNISAPGVSICSTVPTNSWNCGYSGTSMASPHTAGAVALLWSCNPDMIGQMDLTFEALQDATDVAPEGNCGVPPDGEGNYTYGYGYLNVLNAGVVWCGGIETGTLEGHVYDQNMNPVEGATVNAQPTGEANGITATTDPNGYYTMDLVVGTYDVTASKVNYTSQTVTGVEILANTTTTQDFQITFLGAWTQISLPAGCPDWTRLDGEYFPGTGLVYLMGGRPGTDTDGSIYTFDGTGCEDTGVDMPVPISNYTILPLTVGGVDWLCTFGGRNSAGTMVTTVQCYDPLTNGFATLADLPSVWSGYLPGGMAVVDNKAYIFGGFSSTTTPYNHAYTYMYDPDTNTYTQKGDLTVGRSYIDVAVYDGKIYAFGGDTYDGAALIASAKTEMFDPAVGTWNDAAVSDLPTASGEGRAYAFDTGSGYELEGNIVIAGGGQWSSAWNEVEIYNVAADTYDYDFPNLNTLRRDHAGFFVPGNPGKMWVYGGWSGADTPPFGPPEYYEVAAGGVEMTMHVNAIEGNFTMDPYGRTVIRMRVQAVDQDTNPLGDVLVDASIWWPDGGPVARERYTKPAGWARFHWGANSSGTWQICVDDLTLENYTYNPDDNVVTCMEWEN